MMAAAVNNSSKESWRQNQATSDTMFFTTVSPFYELTFFDRMVAWGTVVFAFSAKTAPPISQSFAVILAQIGSPLRGSGTSAFG